MELKDGTQVLQQDDILKCISKFYKNAVKNKDNITETVHLLNIFEGVSIKTTDSKTLGELALVNELFQTSKEMKNNDNQKLKVFLGRLKSIIQKAINSVYEKGFMSQSLRTCTITCLAKGHKDQLFLRNWRPIALLSSFYKLIAGVIANGLKQTMCQIHKRGSYTKDKSIIAQD